MRLHALIALAALLAASRAAAHAQQPRGAAPARVPATVAVVDELPHPGEPFVILRRPDVAPHDVILLRKDATADELSAAVQALLVARQVGGDSATERATLRIRPSERGRPARPLPWAPRILAMLGAAEPQPVAGVGSARAVTIWLPRRGRGRAAP